uniref:UPF3A regulator of nonsense mediated mRNA decay n=1 Tax=Varanus komodoensis TaxID=61221 RepID=A0A8D2JHT5_VARKO
MRGLLSRCFLGKVGGCLRDEGEGRPKPSGRATRAQGPPLGGVVRGWAPARNHGDASSAGIAASGARDPSAVPGAAPSAAAAPAAAAATHQPGTAGGQTTAGGEKRRAEEGEEGLSPSTRDSVVIRRLPPSFTKEQLEEQLHPLPAHDYFEFCTSDPSLYPHVYSRAYINFRNPDDILLFRDRFDGYVFIDNKGLEYPAVVEFAPFQKISKKKLKKKDAKAGSIEDDPEYRKFLETYCAEEEKICANPEILLGEIEAKTRELIGLLKRMEKGSKRSRHNERQCYFI